jgi:hypothetical protein
MSDAEPHGASDGELEQKNDKKRKGSPTVVTTVTSPMKKAKSKTKQTTLITQAPTGPHKNYNEDITRILAGTARSYCF